MLPVLYHAHLAVSATLVGRMHEPGLNGQLACRGRHNSVGRLALTSNQSNTTSFVPPVTTCANLTGTRRPTKAMEPAEEKTQLSANFTLKEMVRSRTAEEKHVRNQPTPEEIENGRRLCVVLLQPIRNRFGALRVTSGFRTTVLNKTVGGRPYSAHLWNCRDKRCRAAADFQPLLAELQACFDWIRLKSGLAFDQVVLERGKQGRHEVDDVIHIAWTDGRPRRQAFMGETFNRGPYVPVTVN